MDIATRKIMVNVKRRLTRAVNLHLMACGREDDVELALRAEDQLLEYVERQLIERVRGLPGARPEEKA